MSLIDSTYFVGDIQLDVGEYSTLSSFITVYEKQFLIKAFGYELYKEIAAYDSETSDQRIKDLVEGKEYTIDWNGRSQLIKYNGLINTDLISPIAYYVYYHFVRGQASINVTTGQIKPNNENASNADLSMQVQGSWNRLLELTGYEGQNLNIPSIYNFINENITEYPEWDFTDFGFVNAFDL